MRMKLAFTTAATLLSLLSLVGCTDKSCNKADSQAVCQQTKLCFESGTSASSCRTAETAAREYKSNYKNNIAPALGGAADALRYDPGTAKTAKKPQQRPSQPPPRSNQP